MRQARAASPSSQPWAGLAMASGALQPVGSHSAHELREMHRMAARDAAGVAWRTAAWKVGNHSIVSYGCDVGGGRQAVLSGAPGQTLSAAASDQKMVQKLNVSRFLSRLLSRTALRLRFTLIDPGGSPSQGTRVDLAMVRHKGSRAMEQPWGGYSFSRMR